MADAVHVQTVFDGARNTVIKCTNLSDGTGEAAVLKVNPALLTPNPGTTLKLRRILYDVKGGAVRIQWVATTAIDILICSDWGDWDFRPESALPDDAGVGATGGIQFTTVGFALNSAYTITLELRKGVQLI
jgi:hypothetical protein